MKMFNSRSNLLQIHILMGNINVPRVVVVVQLVQRSLLTPEMYGSNPDISIILSTNWTIDKTKIKKKSLGMALL